VLTRTTHSLCACRLTRYNGFAVHLTETRRRSVGRLCAAPDGRMPPPSAQGRRPNCLAIFHDHRILIQVQRCRRQKKISGSDRASVSVATRNSTHALWVAWLLTSVYYFYQYALRFAPAVMMPQLSHALNLNPVGIASLAGGFYCSYSPFSLVTGAAIDRFGT
jgi:hypothetical protein